MDEKEMSRIDKKSSFVYNLWHQTVPLFTTKLKDTAMTSFIMFTIFAISSGFYMWMPDILSKVFAHPQEELGVCDIIQETIAGNRVM